MDVAWWNSLMSFNIKNDEAPSPARQRASAAGESIPHAVTVAVSERLYRAARILEIARDAAERWVESHRTIDHRELLYGEAGLPR